MNNYPLLLNILLIYSASYCLSDEELDGILLNSYRGDSLTAIKKELQKILNDDCVPLVKFLDMDGLEAYPTESENDAREFLVECIWNVLFPNEEL